MSFWTRFIEWQNYVHYILLGVFISVEVYYWQLYGLAWYIMLPILILLIFVNDTIIHGIFWFSPKPIQWRD